MVGQRWVDVVNGPDNLIKGLIGGTGSERVGWKTGVEVSVSPGKIFQFAPVRR